jgi:phosphoribosyl 1,2-cyclic phosphodiesterase
MVPRPMPQSSQPRDLRVRVLRSGSSGNAILVETDTTRIIVDAGLPADAILRELEPNGASARVDAILQTHEHDDHAKGAGALSRATGASIWMNAPTLRSGGAQFAPLPVEVFQTGRSFVVGDLEIESFLVPHDAAEPVGFVIHWRGRRVVAACDLGDVTDSLIDRARGADLLLLEANYDVRLLAISSYPWFLKNRILSLRGHLSNDLAARAVAAAARHAPPSTVYLVHLSEMNNLASLARDTVRDALAAEGATHVRVEAVRANSGSAWWTIGAATPAVALAAAPGVAPALTGLGAAATSAAG